MRWTSRASCCVKESRRRRNSSAVHAIARPLAAHHRLAGFQRPRRAFPRARLHEQTRRHLHLVEGMNACFHKFNATRRRRIFFRKTFARRASVKSPKRKWMPISAGLRSPRNFFYPRVLQHTRTQPLVFVNTVLAVRSWMVFSPMPRTARR